MSVLSIHCVLVHFCDMVQKEVHECQDGKKRILFVFFILRK